MRKSSRTAPCRSPNWKPRSDTGSIRAEPRLHPAPRPRVYCQPSKPISTANRQAAIRPSGASLHRVLLLCAGLLASLAAFGVELAQDAVPLGDIEVRVALD